MGLKGYRLWVMGQLDSTSVSPIISPLVLPRVVPYGCSKAFQILPHFCLARGFTHIILQVKTWFNL
jgi:hypothetical protein